MAIARMLPTNLFFIPEFSRLYESSKLASIGLLLHADDEGRGYDDPHTLARAIDSYDSQVEISLKQLHEKGLILIYEVKGKRYYQITNWGQMQVIRYPHTSAFPPPEVPEPATLTRTETTTQNHQLPTSEPSPASTPTNTTTITNIN